MADRTTVPAELVHRLDGIFMNVPGVDTVELGALLLDMAEKPAVAMFASAGGKARAAKLTPERKKEIARNAAGARWAERRIRREMLPNLSL